MPHMPRFQTHPGDIDAFDADPDGDLIWPQGHPQPKVCNGLRRYTVIVIQNY